MYMIALAYCIIIDNQLIIIEINRQSGKSKLHRKNKQNIYMKSNYERGVYYLRNIMYKAVFYKRNIYI